MVSSPSQPVPNFLASAGQERPITNISHEPYELVKLKAGRQMSSSTLNSVANRNIASNEQLNRNILSPNYLSVANQNKNNNNYRSNDHLLSLSSAVSPSRQIQQFGSGLNSAHQLCAANTER